VRRAPVEIVKSGIVKSHDARRPFSDFPMA
jgi:hypothetical protein